MSRRFCSISGGIGKLCFITSYNWVTITADRYQQPLINLSDAFEEKSPCTAQERRKVILLHDNGVSSPYSSDNKRCALSAVFLRSM